METLEKTVAKASLAHQDYLVWSEIRVFLTLELQDYLDHLGQKEKAGSQGLAVFLAWRAYLA